jgi:hypothetical protein
MSAADCLWNDDVKLIGEAQKALVPVEVVEALTRRSKGFDSIV